MAFRSVEMLTSDAEIRKKREPGSNCIADTAAGNRKLIRNGPGYSPSAFPLNAFNRPRLAFSVNRL